MPVTEPSDTPALGATLGLTAVTPEACRSLADVRQAIDAIDRAVIELLGLRLGYVLAARRYKPDAAAIPAPERVAAMLPKRRRWAQENGIDPDFAVPLFSQIIQWFIQQQQKAWAADHARPDEVRP